MSDNIINPTYTPSCAKWQTNILQQYDREILTLAARLDGRDLYVPDRSQIWEGMKAMQDTRDVIGTVWGEYVQSCERIAREMREAIEEKVWRDRIGSGR